MKPLDALQDFLLKHLREVDIRRLARSCSKHNEIGDSLPGRPVDHEELVFAAVEAFDRHGAIDADFWECLHRARPKLTAKIAALQALFLTAPARTTPLRLVITRINRSERRHFLEIEFVLRNDSAVTQVVHEIHVSARNMAVDYQTAAEVSATLDDGKFRFLVINNGWGSVRFDGELSVRCGQRIEIPRVVMSEVVSGARAVGWETTFPAWEVAMTVQGTLENLVTGEVIEVREEKTVFDSRLFGGPHSVPDTTYICILDAERSEQHRVYRTVRAIAPQEVDIFQCALSATKAAKFDISVDVIVPGEAPLSTQYTGLHVWRDAQKDYEFDVLEDGSVFVRGSDNVWRLANPTTTPWQT